jgi:hypothetical protein
MIKTLNERQLYQYVKEHGITEAVTNKDFRGVPAGTKLHFNVDDDGYLSSYDNDTGYLNEHYGYDFDYRWDWGDYKGYFLVDDPQSTVTVKEKIKSIKETTMSMLMKKWKDLRLTEPEKSFRKAGVQNESGELTQEGRELFMHFLMEKYKEEFNQDVVQVLLKEQGDE